MAQTLQDRMVISIVQTSDTGEGLQFKCTKYIRQTGIPGKPEDSWTALQLKPC